MIVDLHTHCFHDSLAARAVSILAAKSKTTPHTNGTINGLKESMARAGITISFIQPIATKPEQTTSINRWAEEVQDERIRCFGTLHPDFSDWENEIKRLVEAGIRGVKLHPDYQHFFVDEPRMLKIYEKIFEAGLIILFHAGIDIGLPEPCHCPPDRLKTVLDSFPGAKIIAAHMGGYLCWEEVEKYLLGRDVYFDTSFSLTDLGPQTMTKIIKEHGAKKILFGTDSPWTDQAKEIAALKALNLDPQELQMIFSGTAKDLLDLVP